MAYLCVYIFALLYTHTHNQAGCVTHLSFSSDRCLIAWVIPWVYMNQCLWCRDSFILHCYYLNFHCDYDPPKMAQASCVICFMFGWITRVSYRLGDHNSSLIQWISDCLWKAAFLGTLCVQNACSPATYCFLLEGRTCGEKQHVSRYGYLPSYPAFRKITVTLAFGIGPGVVLALSAYL